MEAALNTKELLKQGITHILNVSCVEYTKRPQYFKYYNLSIYDNHDEDIKKYFRITNRFIAEVDWDLYKGTETGRVLVHSEKGKSRAPAFVIAYLINNRRITFKEAINHVGKKMKAVEINDYFKKQLEDYDLGKLASVSKQDKGEASEL